MAWWDDLSLATMVVEFEEMGDISWIELLLLLRENICKSLWQPCLRHKARNCHVQLLYAFSLDARQPVRGLDLAMTLKRPSIVVDDST